MEVPRRATGRGLDAARNCTRSKHLSERQAAPRGDGAACACARHRGERAGRARAAASRWAEAILSSPRMRAPTSRRSRCSTDSSAAAAIELAKSRSGFARATDREVDRLRVLIGARRSESFPPDAVMKFGRADLHSLDNRRVKRTSRSQAASRRASWCSRLHRGAAPSR